MSRKRKHHKEEKSSRRVKSKAVVESKQEITKPEKVKTPEPVLIKEESKKTEVSKLRYTVSLRYGVDSIYSTDDYKDAVDHCNDTYKVFDSDGVKVYPTPARRLISSKYYSVMKPGNSQLIGKYHELQEAINHCPIEYNVYDPGGDIVY